MKSIKELYRIGIGPSSSHTMGPRNAAILFLNRNLGSKKFQDISADQLQPGDIGLKSKTGGTGGAN